ncbi:MAG: HGGxSTG domain-containing protein [Rhodomicrobium sp.]
MALCGARAKDGKSGPCQAEAMPNGRCRAHGGLSTGPTSQDGLARLAEANRVSALAVVSQQVALV